MITKEELFNHGLIYENEKSGSIGVNYEMFTGLGDDYLNEFLAFIKENTSEKNYNNIVLGFSSRGIGKNSASYKKSQENNTISIKKEINNKCVEESTIKYEISAIDQVTEQLQSFKSKKAKFIDKISNENAEVLVDSVALEKFIRAAHFHNDIKLDLSLNIKDYVTNTEKNFTFDITGLRTTDTFKNGVLTKHLDKEGFTYKTTVYRNALPAIIQVKSFNEKGFQTLSSTENEYDDNKALVKAKTVNTVKQHNEFKPKSKISRNYSNGKLVAVRINDIQYGKKKFAIVDNIINITDDNLSIDFITDKPYEAKATDNLTVIKEILAIEGGIRQLQNYVSELNLNYKAIINDLYDKKLTYVKNAIENKEVIIYMGDKGNTTIYDRTGTRVAYFPANIINKVIPNPKALPNAMVEQSIKVGNDSNAIKRLYWLGIQEGEGKGIYAFHRSIKALCQNKATPSEVLDDIANRIFNGQFDESNLVFIASNKNASKDTLEKIYHSTSSILVKTRIKENNIEVTNNEYKSESEIADDILGD